MRHPGLLALLLLVGIGCAVEDGGEVLDEDAGAPPRDTGTAGDASPGDDARDGGFDALPGMDTSGSRDDAPGDGALGADGAFADGTAGGDGARPREGCGPRELCANMVDDDCDGMVDEGCPCAPGTAQRCTTLEPGQAGRGTCRHGMQTCTGTGEFGAWGPCEGETLPGPEVCDGMDNDCDGMTDEGLARECYPGPMGTAGVGPCRAGMQTCAMGLWGMCLGAVVPTMEVCGNGRDDDCNGMVDDCRPPCIMGSGSAMGSPWQMHRVMGPVCFGRRFSTHGDPGEFALSRIPAESDPGWTPVTATTIDFAQRSALCGRTCECLDGGEFTYFQTFFEITGTFRVTSLLFTASSVDDGAQVTVFNSRYPMGIVEPGSYLRLGGMGSTADLARYIVPGRNRVVITHIDDCCSDRVLSGVRVMLNGGALPRCL